MKGIFLDIETNGLDPRQHCPLEIAFIIKHLISGKTLAKYQTMIHVPASLWEKKDPESMKINGITWEKVQQGKTLETCKNEIIELFKTHEIQRQKAYFICQNPSFDRAFFAQIVPVYEQEKRLWPYHWLDLASMYWAKISPEILASSRKNPLITLSKNHIARSLNLKEEPLPHLALNGVTHLVEIYETLIGFRPS